MSYSVEIIRKGEQCTSTWSGGTTTQLAIYPKNSDYKARNFKWRLSSACVEIEESTFTSLSGIWRHIMIIEGEMKLEHEGHHSVLLRPFEKDSFDGGWTTKSIGRARDFNLMLGQGCKGSLEAVIVGKAANIVVEAIIPEAAIMYSAEAFYCAAGSARVDINGENEYTLYEGDLMVINNMSYDECGDIGLECVSQFDTVIIRAGISY